MREQCECERWVTGGLLLEVTRDAETGHAMVLTSRTRWPEKTAVSPGFAGRLNGQMPGAVDVQDDRLVFRADNTEQAYDVVGKCRGCGYWMLKRA